MDWLIVIVAFGTGAAAGVIVARLFGREREAAAIAEASGTLRASEASAKAESEAARKWSDDLEERLAASDAQQLNLRRELDQARSDISALETEKATFDVRREELAQAHEELKTAFQALSADALRQNSEAFLQLARPELEKTTTLARTDLEKRQTAIQELLAPIKEGLSGYDKKIGEIELERSKTFGALGKQLEQVVLANDSLRGETQKLVQALKAPRVRGRWGEIQLERVVELAGMIDHCDFRKQESIDTEAGRLRPDMVIELPNGKTIVVDAKTPLEAYIAALEAPNEEQRTEHLIQHARQVRSHIDQLAKKSYWDQFGDTSPEFVVMFIPGEAFFSAALEHDPALIEAGVERQVILATPTTLIALLKAVAYGWRQERITREAVTIAALGKELYARIAKVGDHLQDLGKGLNRAVGAYNNAVSSLESRVLVTARKFAEMNVSGVESLDELSPLESAPRQLQAPELTGGAGQALSAESTVISDAAPGSAPLPA